MTQPDPTPAPSSAPAPTLNHFDASGQAHMVDVGHKATTARRAVAQGCIHMQTATLALIQQGQAAKGDVLAVARLAGIMAAKKTADLIPLCHPLALTHVSIEFEMQGQISHLQDVSTHSHLSPDAPSAPPTAAVWARATVATTGVTGVEMEALTAASVALLTIYDMCKAVDKGMTMHHIGLLSKTGGKSGDWSTGTS